MTNISDHGHDDPIEFNLSEGWAKVAQFGTQHIAETIRKAEPADVTMQLQRNGLNGVSVAEWLAS